MVMIVAVVTAGLMLIARIGAADDGKAKEEHANLGHWTLHFVDPF